ncbi:MAG: DUF1800 family protein, partial [Betaproteobacteria bacterium]
NLFSPPNVKGWPGGEAWIDASTLLARKQFVETILRYEESRTMRSMAAEAAPAIRPSRALLAPQPAIGADGDEEVNARQLRVARALERAFRDLSFSATRWVASLPGDTPAAKRRAAQVVLLPIAPAGGGAAIPAETDTLAFVRATMLDPAYQLK